MCLVVDSALVRGRVSDEAMAWMNFVRSVLALEIELKPWAIEALASSAKLNSLYWSVGRSPTLSGGVPTISHPSQSAIPTCHSRGITVVVLSSRTSAMAGLLSAIALVALLNGNSLRQYIANNFGVQPFIFSILA